MVEASPCGSCIVITICHLFVKFNDACVRFISQSLPPFAVSLTLAGKLAGCTLDKKLFLSYRLV